MLCFVKAQKITRVSLRVQCWVGRNIEGLGQKEDLNLSTGVRMTGTSSCIHMDSPGDTEPLPSPFQASVPLLSNDDFGSLCLSDVGHLSTIVLNLTLDSPPP